MVGAISIFLQLNLQACIIRALSLSKDYWS